MISIRRELAALWSPISNKGQIDETSIHIEVWYMKTIRMLYPEGKQKAFTLSYDDGCVGDRKLAALFNKYHLKGTFHLNSRSLLDSDDKKHVNADEIKELYAGHEVSIHSLTHPNLAHISRDLQLYEIMKDRENLERLCGYAVRGMSYPLNSWNPDTLDVLKAIGIVYSRTTESTGNFSLPKDWLLWHPTAHHSHRIAELADRFLNLNADLATLYVWGHSFEFDLHPDDPQNNWTMMETFCEKMSGHSDVWYATNIEIYSYVTALRSLYFTLDLSMVSNPSAADVWLKVKDQIIKIPGGTTVILP